jgi:hypothetical protein
VFPLGNVNASDTDTTIARRSASYVGGNSSVVQLSITSKDLVIAGRFDHWLPVAMEGNGAEGAVQVLFDVTGLSTRQEDGELFSFEATKVKRVNAQSFAVTGLLKQGEVERTVEALVQTPMAHTPFVAITFPLDATAFPELWGDLSALVSGHNDNAVPMSPRAWLRAPALAAA